MKHKLIRKLAGATCLLVLLFPALTAKGQAQTTPVEEWTTQEGTQYFFYKSATVTDGSGNVFKTGSTINASGNHDIITIKYNSSGVQQWAAQYTGAGNGDDAGARVAVDGSGNVFVVGGYYASSTDSNNCILIKYNSSGTQQWTATYDGGQGRSDAGANLKIDASTGDIYVCGTTYTNSTDQYDFLILKYNSSGTQQWVSQWDNVDLWDGAHKISLAGGKVTVSGGSQTTATKYDFATVQYSYAGVFQSSSLAGGSNPVGFNKITGLVADASNNFYITGAVQNATYDWYTMKLDVNLNQLWTATYNGSSSLWDEANDVQVDGNGNVYVTGFTTSSTQGKNFTTVKYNSSGTQQWAVTYNGSNNGDDEGTALAVNTNNDVYVTGWTNNSVNKDYLTMRLDPSNGNTKWEISYNSNANAEDRATDIAIDNAGDIIVAGQGEVSAHMSYNTVKYSEKEIITPPDTLSSGWQYIENRGQLMGSNSQAAASVKFYNNQSWPQVYFTGSALNYVFSNKDTITTDTDTLTRVDMTFSGASNTSIYALNKRNDYFSYFYSHLTDGLGMVPLYNRLITPEAYSKIDVMYASNTVGMSMYFIIKPGGKPSDIQMTYAGADSVTVNGSGELILATVLGSIVHPKATAFEINSSGSRVSLAWQPTYNIVSANNVQFANIGTYNTSNTLVIEVNYGPNTTAATTYTGMIWATYYGGGLDDDFLDVRTITDGSAIACGQTSSSNWPATTGIIQDTLEGGQDAVVAKFDSIGVRKWATYYGGSTTDWAEALTTDSAGTMIIVTGTTASTDFPVYDPNPSSTAGAYHDNSFNGNRDIFTFKLNATGTTRLNATFYGSTGNERGNDIVKDNLGNYYVVGFSTAGFPTQNKTGAYNNSTQSGQTGAILKFNSADSLVWATRYPVLFINGADITNDNKFIIIGDVSATGLPLYNPVPGTSYVDSTHNGSFDAFLSAFNTNDTLRWSTYLGSSGLDRGNAVTHDKVGNIFAVGEAGGSNFPFKWTGSPAYIDSTLSSSDLFIHKFNSQAELKWGTLYGGNVAEEAKDICTDENTIYVTGLVQSGSPSWEWQTATNAFNQQQHNFFDAYIIAFKNNTNERTWSTNYSGTDDDVGAAIAVDRLRNNLFLVGTTKSKGDSVTSWNLPVQNNSLGTAHYVYRLNAASTAQSQSNAYMDAFIAEFNTLPVVEVGISEISTNFNYEVGVYPNPAIAQVNIAFELNEKQKVEINVYNMIGEKLYGENLGERSGKITQHIDLTTLATGMYIIQVKVGNEYISKKVIKQY